MNQNICLLVDTGAAISVISEQFYRDILRPNVLLQNNNLIEKIKTADGHTTPIIGFAQFVVTIGDQIYNCGASVVPNFTYPIVLGCDFLHKNGAVINGPSEKVTFSSNNTIAFAGNAHNSFAADFCVSNT